MPPLRPTLPAAVPAALAVLLAAAPAGAQTDGSLTAGRRLAATHCGHCHAVDQRDQSPDPRARRLRELGPDFPFDGLRQALAEHMIVGHPEMPVVVLSQAEIGDLVTYLKSIQGPAPPRGPKERGA